MQRDSFGINIDFKELPFIAGVTKLPYVHRYNYETHNRNRVDTTVLLLYSKGRNYCKTRPHVHCTLIAECLSTRQLILQYRFWNMFVCLYHGWCSLTNHVAVLEVSISDIHLVGGVYLDRHLPLRLFGTAVCVQCVFTVCRSTV